MGGKGGGAWKVAYADFVTAMMAFFLVMWITAQNKPVKEAIAGYFKDPSGSSDKIHGMGLPALPTPLQSKAEKGNGTGASPAQRQKQGAEEKGTVKRAKGGTEIDSRKDGMWIINDSESEAAGAVILFPEDSAELNEENKRHLDKLAHFLMGKRHKIEVRGHTSRKPIPSGGEFEDAWRLSYERCRSVIRHLEDAGIEPDRLRISQSAGYEPLTLNTDAESLARNSRVEVFQLREFADELQGTKKERSNRVSSPRVTTEKPPK